MPRQCICSNCGLTKQHFAKGLCKGCYGHAYYLEHHEERQAWQQAYDAAHRNERAASQAAHYAAHREELLAWHRAYRAAHPEKAVARQRTYRAAHPEKVRADVRAYAVAHPEWRRDRNRAYKAKHRAELAARQRAYQVAHPVEKLARQRAWNAAHPDKVRELGHRKRARRQAAFVAPVSMDELYARDKGICGICGKPVTRKAASLDHILPIAAGGSHEPRNARIAHLRCNIRRQHRGEAQLRLLG